MTEGQRHRYRMDTCIPLLLGETARKAHNFLHKFFTQFFFYTTTEYFTQQLCKILPQLLV